MRIPTSIAPGSSKSSLFTQDFHKRVQMNIVAKLFGKKKKGKLLQIATVSCFSPTNTELFALHFIWLPTKRRALFGSSSLQTKSY
jgi:hypothetical protein